MKLFICILASVLFLIPHTQGQTFAANQLAINSETNQPAMANFTNYSYSSHGTGNGVWIAGTILMGVGGITFLGGAVYSINVGFEEENASNNNYGGYMANNPYSGEARTATLVMVGGAVAFAAGTVMLIEGLRAHRHSKHRYGVIAPKKDQIGLAYNF